MKKILLFLALTAFMGCSKQELPAYLNESLSFEERASDLVSRMTLEQKISQLNYESAAVDSLGVKEYNWWNECLHGVARAGLATVFPQAIGMAATWDQDNMFNVATAISDEGRAKYNDFQRRGKRGIYEGITFWTPNINIFRDPRWGRGMETYGEDPYLTGKMAVKFINGLQGDNPRYLKTVATAKHFAVHSGPESTRHTFNAEVSDFDLWDTYLPAFQMCVKDANVASVMCAYNRFRGKPCCGSSPLLNEILRKEWDFNGYVVSDCWALVDFYNKGAHEVVETKAEAAAMAFRNGTDINCGSVSPYLADAVKEGLIEESEIDKAVTRLFIARMKLGMFDKNVPFNSIGMDVVDSEEHKALALKTARKSIVLLKNENNVLPLSKDLKKIAVIGPNANDVEVLLANYNGIPSAPVTPLQGIKEKLPNSEVVYALGCEHAKDLPVMEAIPSDRLFTDKDLKENGLKAEYFDTAGFNREPLHSRIDKNVDFYWWDKAPFEGMDDDNFAVRWTGYFVPEVSGRYGIGSKGFYSYNFYFEDSLLISDKNIHHSLIHYEYLDLEAGKPYKIKIEYFDIHGDAEMRLLWDTPGENNEADAIAAVEAADAVVLFMGLSPRLEGEEMKVRVDGFDGGDRVITDLPQIQIDLMKKLKTLGKPMVLVLLNGSSLSVDWADENIPAIVEAWYPGQAGGTAIADVLFGDYNPAGRLPVTFYKSVKDLPAFDDYNMEGRTYRYFRGEPLYPFGYGLSYTDFSYTDLTLSKTEISKDETCSLTVSVKNSGEMDGEEVVQLYVKDVQSENPRPIKALRNFKRINLSKGEQTQVEFEINKEILQFYNPSTGNYEVEPGEFILLVGSSSADKDLKEIKLRVLL